MIDLLELSAEIRAGDADAAAAARAQAGPTPDRLARLAEWWAEVTGRWPCAAPTRVRLVLSAPPTAAVAEFAAESEVGIRLLEADGDADAAVAAGVDAADEEIDSGGDLFLLATAAGSAGALVLISLLTGAEPVALLPRGAAARDSSAWIALAVAIRDGRREATAVRHQPAKLLAALGDPVLAATFGFALRSVARRTPLLLEGTGALAGALLCADLHHRAAQWWQVADSSAAPADEQAVQHLGERTLLDLQAGAGRGLSALVAVPLLRAAVAQAQPEVQR